MLFTSSMRLFCTTSRFALASSACLLPATQAAGYQYIHPQEFSRVQSVQILKELGANDSLLRIHGVASEIMTDILASQMVQGMAKGTLTKEDWEKKYMKADALYIYKLGQELAKRSKNELEKDRVHVMEFADMFLGYGKHFDRLKKYGLSANDTLDCQECDAHIAFLSTETSINEFYVSILTDMIPYVVFANYLLRSIEPSDDNPWMEYAQKYGDLKNKYAREKLGKMIQIANDILAHRDVETNIAEKLFLKGFTFERWFIDNAFSKGFDIIPSIPGSRVSQED